MVIFGFGTPNSLSLQYCMGQSEQLCAYALSACTAWAGELPAQGLVRALQLVAVLVQRLRDQLADEVVQHDPVLQA